MSRGGRRESSWAAATPLPTSRASSTEFGERPTGAPCVLGWHNTQQPLMDLLADVAVALRDEVATAERQEHSPLPTVTDLPSTDATPAPTPAFVATFTRRPAAHQPLPCAWLDAWNPTRPASPLSPPAVAPAACMDLPSLVDLSAPYLSINDAYHGAYYAAAAAAAAATYLPSFTGVATLPPLPLLPAAEAPPATSFSTTCLPVATFHLQCRDAATCRGATKTG